MAALQGSARPKAIVRAAGERGDSRQVMPRVTFASILTDGVASLIGHALSGALMRPFRRLCGETHRAAVVRTDLDIMFAVVRTGGKQYRVAEGDKIAVEKLAGEAGDTIELGDILLAGEGDSIADAAKVKVSAEIIAQAKSEKVIVFKKRRRHNYRRRNGHRQQLTLLRIVSVGV